MVIVVVAVCGFLYVFFLQAEDGIRDLVRSRGLGDVYKRQHTVFGEVVKGMEVVDRIGEVPVTSKHLPVDPVRIISVQRVEPEK